MFQDLLNIVERVALAEVPHIGSVDHGPHGEAWDDAVHREAVARGYVEIIHPVGMSGDQSSGTWWVRITASGRNLLLHEGKLPAAMTKPQWPGSRRKSKHR